MHLTWFTLFFFTFIFFTLAEDPKERPLVTTPLGQIRGYHKRSTKRNVFSAFEGIPYAKPPIENRRFEPPEAVEPWEGIWDATIVTECPQTSLMKIGTPQGEEDCLYLNVYVPREQPKSDEKLDVIVHIHGGLFMYGSGHGYSHPEYFMDEEVIFVNLNYRLNIFGFLSTEDNEVSGNMGLKDQVLALKWVQENIASFGGNPDSVTLTGLSAGASSVQFHYLSDMSVGLFHRGFSQSGVALNSFALQENALAKAKTLAEAVGCTSTTNSILVKCLKQRPFRHLLTKMPLFYKQPFLPVSPFAPVLEKGSKPFLSKNPYFLLAKGKVQDLPWMTSSVSHEGFFPAIFFKKDLDTINLNWTQVAPYLLDFSDTLAEVVWNNAAEKIREKYFGEEDINDENFLKLVNVLNDRFLVDVEAAIKLQAKSNKSPVFYYQFGYVSDSSTTNAVAHGEDAQYFFYSMYNKPPTPDELNMKELLINMLLTFVKTGKPSIHGVKWDEVEYPEITLVNITSFDPDGIKVQAVNELAPGNFWKSLGFLENQNLVLIKDEL